MARGWDSKAVEDQIESAQVGIAAIKESKKQSEHELTRIRARQGLELMRSRVTQQIERTQNDRYREMLHKELTALDQQLTELS
jgi:ribosome maturation protein Sdo1